MNAEAMLIELRGVSVVRSSTRILGNLTLSVPQRQNIAIVGPNGSGKSTLLKLLMKFFYPSVVDGQSGTVMILGREAWNVWELREHLGFVPRARRGARHHDRRRGDGGRRVRARGQGGPVRAGHSPRSPRCRARRRTSARSCGTRRSTPASRRSSRPPRPPWARRSSRRRGSTRSSR